VLERRVLQEKEKLERERDAQLAGTDEKNRQQENQPDRGFTGDRKGFLAPPGTKMTGQLEATLRYRKKQDVLSVLGMLDYLQREMHEVACLREAVAILDVCEAMGRPLSMAAIELASNKGAQEDKSWAEESVALVRKGMMHKAKSIRDGHLREATREFPREGTGIRDMHSRESTRQSTNDVGSMSREVTFGETFREVTGDTFPTIREQSRESTREDRPRRSSSRSESSKCTEIPEIDYGLYGLVSANQPYRSVTTEFMTGKSNRGRTQQR